MMLFKDHTYQFEPVVLDVKTERIIKDLPYGRGVRHYLDLYLPVGSGPFPLIIDLYGGGLLRGEKSSYKLHPSLRFVDDGYAVASPNYSLNSVNSINFPNQVAEIRAVIEYCQAHADQYCLDSSRFFLIGESSGAQLALLAGASFSAKTNLGHMPGKSFQTSFPTISGIIGLYGPYELDQFHQQFQQLAIQPKFQECGLPFSFEGIALGKRAPHKVPEKVAQANPSNYFTTKMPPVMLLAGTADRVVPYLQSVDLGRKYLKMVGRPAHTLWVADANHGIADFDNPTIHQAKLDFLSSIC
ncbi:alpha/beta hydrolase [Convivina praedatoris]|uniref:alpha/beta hydrolase n=1 Tax=Convivina praedatoris TaxID=2880963 RepID=UPI00200DBACA|nr:alpha/beta hydrolase [Convivina sp. LMG 32447]CAH1856777.1 hypothetical protein R078138_01425 [Convivina sp. LMG 32447]